MNISISPCHLLITLSTSALVDSSQKSEEWKDFPSVHSRHEALSYHEFLRSFAYLRGFHMSWLFFQMLPKKNLLAFSLFHMAPRFADTCDVKVQPHLICPNLLGTPKVHDEQFLEIQIVRHIDLHTDRSG